MNPSPDDIRIALPCAMGAIDVTGKPPESDTPLPAHCAYDPVMIVRPQQMADFRAEGMIRDPTAKESAAYPGVDGWADDIFRGLTLMPGTPVFLSRPIPVAKARTDWKVS